jgi:hypothetical protein
VGRVFELMAAGSSAISVISSTFVGPAGGPEENGGLGLLSFGMLVPP